MKDLLPFLVVGIASGSLFGLTGIGLVLTFKTTGVFNFAHGAVAAVAAYLFYDLHAGASLPWPLAAVTVVVGFGGLAGVCLERLGRALARTRVVLGIAATVGLLLLVQGLLTVRYGSTTLPFPPFLPQSGFEMAGVLISWEQVIVAVTALVAAVGLVVFFRISRLGLSMRAVVDDPALVALAGIAPRRVRIAAWIIGCSFASLSGVLIASSLGRDPSRLTLLVVQAFGAAAVGRFSNLARTYLGGLVVGVASSLATYLVASHPSLIGVPPSVPFIILFVALLVTPAHQLAVRAPIVLHHATTTSRKWGTRLRVGAGGITFIALIATPRLVGTDLPVYLNAAVLVPMFVSLGLLVWTSGQLSLCHAAFVALGATSFSHLTGAGTPWLIALVLAGLATVPLGAVVAVPAVRLSGIYLALATFGFGILVQRLLYPSALMFGPVGFRSAPRPDLGFVDLRGDEAYFLVAAGVAVASVAVVSFLQRSRLGRVLRALGDSPTALNALGTDTNVARLVVFCVAAFLAGISGALSISASSQVSVDTFGLQQSLLWLTVLAVGGSTLLFSPIAAAALIAVAPTYLPASLVDYQPIAFGAAAIVVAVTADRRFRIRPRGRGRRMTSPAQARMTRPEELQAASA